MSEDFNELITELPRWNDGAGIDAEGWVGCMGNYELAVGYSLIFWPRCVEFENYVLREGFSEESLRASPASNSTPEPRGVEAPDGRGHAHRPHRGAALTA